MKRNLILAFAATLLIIFSGKQLNAQTKEDAGNAFNAALELSKTDMAGAVVKMQDVLKMCSVVGKDADSLKIKIGKVLPVFQFNTGNSLMKDRKFDAAIQAFEKSVEFATTYADENKIKDKAEALLVKLYGTKAGMLIKTDADSAIMFADKSLKLDPGFAKALFTKGQAYKKKGDNVKMQENMELAIASATKTNDTIIVKAAKNMIGSSLNQEGLAAFNKKTYSEAVTKLTAALGYGFKNKELYYALSSSYNGLKKYDEAIEAANSGMAMDEQTNEKLARYYCEIAKAYEGKKDNANACANYKKAAFGTFTQFANDKIKNVLKCQ